MGAFYVNSGGRVVGLLLSNAPSNGLPQRFPTVLGAAVFCALLSQAARSFS
jgi:hypothetical protein